MLFTGKRKERKTRKEKLIARLVFLNPPSSMYAINVVKHKEFSEVQMTKNKISHYCFQIEL